jgi:hypothetical protein
MRLASFDASAGDRAVTGVLIGRDFNPAIVSEVVASRSRVCLYSFSQQDGELVLTHISGVKALEAAGLVGV